MTSPRDASPIATSKLVEPVPSDKILVLFGTRPEAIKLCPLVRVLKRLGPQIRTIVCVTGQHREMLDQVLAAFDIRPDIDLAIMRAGQTLGALTARLLEGLDGVFVETQPNLTVVQGDTTTALCGALAAFYRRVPVAHVEAGLRTGDFDAPFPEEMNRVLTARLTALHFAPTARAAANLKGEGVAGSAIEVTGNTGIDAVLQVRAQLREAATAPPVPLQPGRKLVVVTAHRRESFGAGFENICRAFAHLAERPDVQIVWPVHPNPNVQSAVNTHLRGRSNVALIEPLAYVPFVDLLSRATLILTDSGGIQEEAPSLGKPVLVLRDSTERPEAVEAGTVRLVGSDYEAIVRECERLLDDAEQREKMSRIHNPYGDGTASERIAKRIHSFLIEQRVG